MRGTCTLKVQWDESYRLGECDAIQGCLLTGYTLDELMRNLPEVLALLYEDSAERGVEFVRGNPELTPSDISWQLEFVNVQAEEMVTA
jgi:predicted RNase H-like HicB family nuclease